MGAPQGEAVGVEEPTEGDNETVLVEWPDDLPQILDEIPNLPNGKTWPGGMEAGQWSEETIFFAWKLICRQGGKPDPSNSSYNAKLNVFPPPRGTSFSIGFTVFRKAIFQNRGLRIIFTFPNPDEKVSEQNDQQRMNRNFFARWWGDMEEDRQVTYRQFLNYMSGINFSKLSRNDTSAPASGAFDLLGHIVRPML
jgi:hypothetical protein